MKTRPHSFQTRTSFVLWTLLLTLFVGACRSDTLGPTLNLDAVLEGDLEIAPGELVLNDGESGFLSVRLIRSDGTVTNLPNNANVTWSSDAPGIASVSSSGTVVGKLPGVAGITATMSSGSATLPVIVLPTPADLRPLFDGDIKGVVGASLPDSVAVRVVDRGGLPVAGVPVSFHVEMGGGSVSPRTAITSSDGSAKVQWRLGTTAGENALRVTSNGLQDAWIHAMGEANGDEDQLYLIGGNAQRGKVDQVLGQELVVRVVDQHGNPVQNAPVTWIFDDGSTGSGSGGGGSVGANSVGASADAQGMARTRWRLGTKAGTNRARAKIGSTAEVWFEAEAEPEVPTSVTFHPKVATVGVGGQVVYRATVVDRFGNPIDNAPLTWETRNPSVATVNGAGVARGLAAGESEIVATTTGGIHGGGDIFVQAVAPARLQITSGNGQSGSVGATLPQPLTVKVTDGSGNPMSGVAVAWAVTQGGGSVSSASTSTDGSGQARVNLTLGNSAQLNQVTASAGGLTPVKFSATAKAGSVAQVSVTPGSVSMVVGGQKQLYASALDGSGNGVSGVSFQWSSSNSSVVSVDGSGRITAASAGTANVTATSGGHSGSASVTVTQTVGGVTLNITHATLNAIGDTAYVTASAVDGSGAKVSSASIKWTSETPNIVGVDAIGRVFTKGLGTGRATASVGSQSATVTIDSRQILAAVSVSPANPSVNVGSSLQLVASAVDSNGVALITSQDHRMFWESSNPGVATVSNTSGMVNAVAKGSTQIKLIWEEDDTHNSRSLRAQATLNVTEGSSPPPSEPPPDQPPPNQPPPPPPPPPANNGPNPDLPNTYINTNYSAPNGAVIRVPSGGDLQGAINQAQPGDQILLAAGGVYVGNFSLPTKSGSGWIVLTTETNLPGQGTRMTPNIASSARLARIESAAGWAPAIKVDPGAKNYRLMGLEVTMSGGVSDQSEIISIGGGTPNWPSNIILDRMYIHGRAGVATKRCVGLNAATGAVVDSYLDRCHKFGQDSQAILIWDGPGPYKIVNNYLAGAGENVMVGGADPATSGLVPSDIEIRRNFFHKPDSWYSNPVGTVKNLFELKNARRVLVEGNIMEGNWSDGQTGWGVLIKSTNQSGGCNWCVSEHITIRNNIMRKMGNGMTIMRTNSAGIPSGSTNNVLIEHNIIDALGSQSGFSGDPSWGSGFLILQGPQNLTIRHNTVISERHIMFLDGGAANGMVFNDNVTVHGQYGVFSSGGAGATAIQNMMPNGQFLGNVLAGANASLYPANNFFPASVGAIGFTGSTNYLLSGSSPYKGLATDGTDPGANIQQVSSATSGVR